MIELIYSPNWFYGKDIIIDIISIFVLSLIAYFSIKYYKISKNKQYLFFAGSFISIALSFLFKVVTNFTLYFNIINIKHLGLITMTYNTIKSSNILSDIGFLLYRLLMLVGLFMLYSTYSKNKKINNILILYFIFVLAYFSKSAYYVFHITALIFLFLITWQYWKNYQKSKIITTKLLIYSFCLITLSQIIFIFIGLHTTFYVIAEIIQLLGYLILLLTFIKVLKNGKKKRKK